MNQWNDDFFKKRKHIAWRAKPVCDQIIHQFNPKSVIDVGCGIGEFLADFKGRGINILGIEGTEKVFPYLMISEEDVIIHDLVDELFFFSEYAGRKFKNFKYDIALCFMVVGRLPEKHWPHIAHQLSVISDTIITVVEKEWLWKRCMSMFGYKEDVAESAIFRNALRPLFSKTAVRSFQHTQIFRRMNNE